MSEENKFEYEGTLVFNGIYQTRPASEEIDLSEIGTEDLSDFERGQPGEERSGFKDIDFSQYIAKYEDLDGSLEDTITHYTATRFREEDYNQPDELVNDEGEPTSGWERTTDESYLYWKHPNQVFLQGSHGKVGRLKKNLNENWSGTVKIEPLEFDPDFLLYLMKEFDDSNRIRGIRIEKLTDAQMSGTISSHGQHNEVRDSSNITESLPVIAGTLLNYEFEELEGTFSFEGFEITANIQTKVRDYRTGRVHIKVENSIENSPHLIRTLISLYFLRRFVGLYESWKDMDPTDKYVHPEYFARLHRRATELPESAEYDFPLRELVDDYAEKREEDIDADELEWGSHNGT